MAKAKSRGCKGVEDRGVNQGVVLFAVALFHRKNVQLIHDLGSKDDWQPLIVSYVLEIAGDKQT